MAVLSADSSHRSADVTHVGLIDEQRGATIAVGAIDDVVQAVRTGAPHRLPAAPRRRVDGHLRPRREEAVAGTHGRPPQHTVRLSACGAEGASYSELPCRHTKRAAPSSSSW